MPVNLGDTRDGAAYTVGNRGADGERVLPQRRSGGSRIASRAVACAPWLRLKELGWKEGSYCPRDGSMFACCMLGSTGIFDANYIKPYVHVYDGGDSYVHHPRELMWRPKVGEWRQRADGYWCLRIPSPAPVTSARMRCRVMSAGQ